MTTNPTTTHTDEERREFLLAHNLNPDAPALKGKRKKVVLDPHGRDPRLLPVEEIVLDAHLLDDFPSLAGDGLAAASAHVFALYKSYGRNKDRNGALHRRITTFITNTRRERETGGLVKEKVKTTKEERDLAQLLASQGITAKDLAGMLHEKKVEGE